MISFDIRDIIPAFILADKNGYAMAKAIEAGLKYYVEKSRKGLDIITDVDAMPEWRLDEQAEDYNILYDYGADIEVKRDWVRNAIPYFRKYGTPGAIYQFLSGYFEDIDLEENWQYGGDPFHFLVTVSGEWTPENEAWARKAIERAKNARSVLDNLRIGCRASIAMIATGEVESRIRYPSAGELRAGEYPTENIRLVIDETPKAGVDARGEAQKIAYEMTGTYPDIATLLEIDGTPLQAGEAQEEITPIYYPMCGEYSCGE